MTSSVASGIAITILGTPIFGRMADFGLFFGTAFMIAGSIMALLQKEIAFRNEYTFYHNMGISKFNLQACTVMINILIGSLCIILRHA